MIPCVPVHIVQRGHCREPVFFDEADYQAYLHWLSEAAAEYGCAIQTKGADPFNYASDVIAKAEDVIDPSYWFRLWVFE